MRSGAFVYAASKTSLYLFFHLKFTSKTGSIDNNKPWWYNLLFKVLK